MERNSGSLDSGAAWAKEFCKEPDLDVDGLMVSR
jgi:hypothetical protein